MENKTTLKTKSIKKWVKNAFILIFVIMLSVFYLSFTMKKIVIKEYNNYAQTSITINQFSTELDKYSILFYKYIKDRDENVYIEYQNSKAKLNIILQNIENNIVDTKSLTFLRNLKNMHEYQNELSSTIITDEKLNLDTYNKITELKRLFDYMNKHIQTLSVSYLNYSSMEYLKLLETSKTFENNIYILFGTAALIIFLFAVQSLRNILHTLDNLTNAAKLLSDAHWEIPDINKTSYNELDTLAIAFNKMKTNIKIFIEELNKKAELENNLNLSRLKNIEKDKLLKESQLRALQAQMDPHFLFNTLNTIGRIAMFENAENSVKLIESISKILRYNLENIGKFVTLKDEITVLKAYITIQETRFQEHITFSFDIEDKIENILIPPMIIQPILENSIIHGLQNRHDGGKICLTIKKKNEYIKIDIIDNGKGMTPEEIQRVFYNEPIKSTESDKIPNSLNSDAEEILNRSRTRIGIGNIRKMLKLYFNRDDLISVKSSTQTGTVITIFIPLGTSKK